jgi:hypothetical protein
LIGDATVQARKRPTQYGWILAVRDSEAAGVRTDEIAAVQHTVRCTEGFGRCLVSRRILAHKKVAVVIYQGLEIVQAMICITSDAFKSDI